MLSQIRRTQALRIREKENIIKMAPPPWERTIHKLLKALFWLLGLIPRQISFHLANIIGKIGFLVDRKHREITINNLTRSYGIEKKSDEIRRLALQVFQNLTQILFELGWSLHLEEKDFPTYFKVHGLSNLQAALSKKKGLLILTAHVGNWELLTIIACMTELPTQIVYRPLDFSPLDRFISQTRMRFGCKLISTRKSMMRILRALKQGDSVAILMDQNVDWYEGVFVDYFGRLACTNKGLALLALRTRSPVVPVFLVRDSHGFRAEILEEVPLIDTGDKTKDLEANTQQYNETIEAFVRRYPNQWFWVHQRWKTPPYHPWPRAH
jgi:KDO2-lipid IV(A) lauroyltransferase